MNKKSGTSKDATDKLVRGISDTADATAFADNLFSAAVLISDPPETLLSDLLGGYSWG